MRARLGADDLRLVRGVPSASGRKPCGSRDARSRWSFVSMTSEKAPCTCGDRLDDRVLDARVRFDRAIEVHDRLRCRCSTGRSSACSHQIVAQLARRCTRLPLWQSAIWPCAQSIEDRLRVEQLALAGRRIAHVSDRQAVQAGWRSVSPSNDVVRRSPSRVRCGLMPPSEAAMPALSLAPMLERVQAEVRHVRAASG